MSQKKYEITEITHPKYPWLHRIRARCQVNEQVGPGALGGYVHSGEWKTEGIGKTAEIRASGGIPERKE